MGMGKEGNLHQRMGRYGCLRCALYITLFMGAALVEQVHPLRMKDVQIDPGGEQHQEQFTVEQIRESWMEKRDWSKYSIVGGSVYEEEDKLLKELESFIPEENCFHLRDNFAPGLGLSDQVCYPNVSDDHVPEPMYLQTLYRAYGGVLPAFKDVLASEESSFTSDVKAAEALAFAAGKFGFAENYNVTIFRRLDLRRAEPAALGQTALQLAPRAAAAAPGRPRAAAAAAPAPPGGGARPHLVQVGAIFYIEVAEGAAAADDGGGGDGGTVHRVAVSLDGNGAFDTLQHTFFRPEEISFSRSEEEGGGSAEQRTEPPGLELKVMSYNIWHTQPAQWAPFGGPGALGAAKRTRAAWYAHRLARLAEVVRREDPDVVGFQEVRYDAAWGGAQVRRLAELLGGGGPGGGGGGYQYVYQPAMLQFDLDRYWNWEDEGVAIFSKYPIIHTDHVLLPLDLSDAQDDHQRVALRAALWLPALGRTVEVAVAHLSLSAAARARAARALAALARAPAPAPAPPAAAAAVAAVPLAHFLLGDLNAEPHEESIQFLAGQGRLDNMTSNFQDHWRVLHPEPRPSSEDPLEKHAALTFPSCNPVKRIDYIFSSTTKNEKDNELEMIITDCYLAGQDPADFVNSTSPGQGKSIPSGGDDELAVSGSGIRRGVGMLDKDSPIWASDHRAVVTKVKIGSTLAASIMAGSSGGSKMSRTSYSHHRPKNPDHQPQQPHFLEEL